MSSICIPPLAPGGSISSCVTASFPSPWPGTAYFSLLPLSMPPGNFAAAEVGKCALSRALASSSSIFRVASTHLAPEFFSFTFFSAFCLWIFTWPIWSVHAWVQVWCILLESPPKTGRRGFLALKIRGHIETLCCGYDCNFHFLQLNFRFWYFWLPPCLS